MFREKYSFEYRLKESTRILEKYPDRVPIIVDQKDEKSLPPIDKKKFLVPFELTFGQFSYVIRRRLDLKPEQSLFMYCENTLVPTNMLMGDVYKTYKGKDLFLVVKIYGENTFG